MQFLGMVMDSERQVIELPEDKVQKLESMAENHERKTKNTKKGLQVHMAFAAKAVFVARTFSRIFIDVLGRLRRPMDHCRVTNILRQKLQWWKLFAKKTDGFSFCSLGKTCSKICISTDASFSGFGAVLVNRA